MAEMPTHCESCPLAPALDEALPRPPKATDCPGPTFILNAAITPRLQPSLEPVDPQIEALLPNVTAPKTPNVQLSILDPDAEPERICGREYEEPEESPDTRVLYTHRGVNGLARFALLLEGPDAALVDRLSEQVKLDKAEAAVRSYWWSALKLFDGPVNRGQLYAERLFFQTDSLSYDIEALATDRLLEANLGISKQAFDEADRILQGVMDGAESILSKTILQHMGVLRSGIEQAIQSNRITDENLRTYATILGHVPGGGIAQYAEFLEGVAAILDRRAPLAGAVDFTAINDVVGRLHLVSDILQAGNFAVVKEMAYKKLVLIKTLLKGSNRAEAELAEAAAQQVAIKLGGSANHLKGVLRNLEKYIATL